MIWLGDHYRVSRNKGPTLLLSNLRDSPTIDGEGILAEAVEVYTIVTIGNHLQGQIVLLLRRENVQLQRHTIQRIYTWAPRLMRLLVMRSSTSMKENA